MMALSTSNYSYQVSDAYAMLEVISAGPIYDQMQQRLMASKGYIPYAFKRFACFDGGQSETTVRFQVISQSVDRIYACSVDYTPTAGVVLANSGLPTDGSEKGLTAEMYSTRALRSRVNPGSLDDYTDGPQLWFTLRGVQLPSFHPSLSGWYSITQAALPKPHPRSKIVPGTFHSYRGWYDTFFLVCCRLCAPNADLKHVSGLDTRNMALDGVLNAGEMGGLDYLGTGLGVWVESTAELRVMPGREV
jgi:hypothetical protein